MLNSLVIILWNHLNRWHSSYIHMFKCIYLGWSSFPSLPIISGQIWKFPPESCTPPGSLSLPSSSSSLSSASCCTCTLHIYIYTYIYRLYFWFMILTLWYWSELVFWLIQAHPLTAQFHLNIILGGRLWSDDRKEKKGDHDEDDYEGDGKNKSAIEYFWQKTNWQQVNPFFFVIIKCCIL